MRVWLAVLLLLPTATGEIVWGPMSEAGPQAIGVGVLEGSGLSTHENLALYIDSPGLSFASESLHDHDAFFWFLTQPATTSPWLGIASTADESVEHRQRLGPSGAIASGPMTEGNDVMAYGDTYFVASQEGRLLAAGFVADSGPGADPVPVFRWPGGEGIDVAVYHLGQGHGRVDRFDYVWQEPPQALPIELPSLALGGEPAPPFCDQLLQEPAGDWYTDTHVRLAWDPASRLIDGNPIHVRYELHGPDGLVGEVAVRDPYGHALLRAPEPGAYRLVLAGDVECEAAVTVLASEGTTAARWDATGGEGGITITFTTDTTAHYDVEALVAGEDGRIVYAGKLHSHGQGVGARLLVPAGNYDVQLWPVAQGPGPTVEGPLARSVTVAQPMTEEATPVPPAWLLLVALPLARRK